MRILVVEDEKNIRENIQEILEIKGYNVVAAKDGSEGLELYHSFKPEFVLCDIMMPILDGYGFLSGVRNLPENNLVPIVFLSAKAEREEIEKAVALGASDFLTKPFSFEDLFNVIEKYSK